MSTVTNLTIGGGFGELFRRIFNVWYHKDSVVVSKKRFRYTRGYKQALRESSEMDEAGWLWTGLSTAEQTAWKTAAYYTNMDGYNLFMQDTMWRLKHDFPGLTTPCIEHQYKYAHCYIPAGAGNVLFRQAGGTTPKNTVYMGCMHTSVMFADGAPPNTLTLRFRYYKLVGGIRTAFLFEQNLDIDTGWFDTYVEQDVGTDCLAGWEFEIEANHVRGNFWFDNIYMTDEDKVFSKDTNCNNVRRFWLGLNLPAGVDLNSIYEE